MKKYIILTFIVTLLTSCSSKGIINPSGNYEIDFTSNKIPYNIALPYQEGILNGYSSQYIYNRFDIDAIEYELMQLATNYYSPDKYSFREGQFLTKDLIKNYLSPSDKNEAGLNPASTEKIKIGNKEINPTYISYIHEQNYLVKTENDYKTEGIAISLVLNPYQYVKSENGATTEYKLTDEQYNQMIRYGEKAAEKLVKNIRTVKGLRFAKVFIGLYVLNSSDSLIPGNYVKVAKTSTDSITAFDRVNLESYLIPSSGFTSKDTTVATSFNAFRDVVNKQFPTYFSMIGKATFSDDELKKIVLELNITFESKEKLLAFTEIVATQMDKFLNGNYIVEIKISSVNRLKATIQREKDNELPSIHIYD